MNKSKTSQRSPQSPSFFKINDLRVFMETFISNPPKEWKLPNETNQNLDLKDLENLKNSAELSKDLLRSLAKLQKFFGSYKHDALKLTDLLNRRFAKTKKEQKLSQLVEENRRLQQEVERLTKAK